MHLPLKNQRRKCEVDMNALANHMLRDDEWYAWLNRQLIVELYFGGDFAEYRKRLGEETQ